MQIVVLMGGKGTRLHPVTNRLPKSLIEINGVPFVEHQIKIFKKNGIVDIILCVGIFGEKIMNHLKDGAHLGVKITYSLEDPKNLLGTLGALVNASKLLEKEFFVTWGDSYLEVDFRRVFQKFKESHNLGLMTVYKNKNLIIPSNLSIKKDMITGYDKENPKNFEYTDYGLLVFKKSVLDFFPRNQNLDLSLLVQKLIAMNQLARYQVRKRFYEIGTFDGIKTLENHLLQ